MKLISCHIENFGKLSDLRVDFVEGINLFHEMNGWGKSTLAAFLRVMFYGFDSKKSRVPLIRSVWYTGRGREAHMVVK